MEDFMEDALHERIAEEEEEAAERSQNPEIEIASLEGSALEWATVDAESARVKSRKSKMCLFCGANYTGGPFNIRMHLDGRVKPRNVKVCNPRAEHRDVYLRVLQELS